METKSIKRKNKGLAKIKSLTTEMELWRIENRTSRMYRIRNEEVREQMKVKLNITDENK